MSNVNVLNRAEFRTDELLARLVREARSHEAIVLDGATGGAVRVTDLGAAAYLARLRSGPAVVITDATWSSDTSLLDRLACRAGLSAIDSARVTYCVLSSKELEVFPRTWGIPAERVVFTPFYFTAGDEDLEAPITEAGGVFSGGDSLRDYGPVLAVARRVPAPFTLATRLVSSRGLPPNVRAGRVTHQAFMAELRRASVVVVALADRKDRSAGQQTYLNAMALGKLVVVPDVMGVRDYVEDGRTGFIVPPGDDLALERAVRWALDPGHRSKVREIAGRARETVRARFAPERYVDAVMGAVQQAVARGAPPANLAQLRTG
jgi:glycosyltransferase involved in cell wall biosynthesis